jgi:hypothetical protein
MILREAVWQIAAVELPEVALQLAVAEDEVDQ